MANTFITPQAVANEALAILRNMCVMKDLVHIDYSKEFVGSIGDTVNVRVPAAFVAKDYNGSTIDKQNATETSVPVKLDRFKDVSFVVTSKDWTLNLQDFAAQLLEPAMVAIAEQVDVDIANQMFEDAGSSVSCTVAAPTNLKDIANVAKVLETNKAPQIGKNLVLGTDHKYRFAITDNLSKASYAGDNLALRDANLGRLYGMVSYTDQNTPKSTAATSGTAVGTIKVASSSDAGEIDITEGSAATATLAVGDGFVYKGILYRLTEAVTLSGSAAASKTVSPAFPASVTATTVSIVRNGTSLGFHKNSFAFVNRPLAIPQGAPKSAVASADGLTIRVVFDYDMDLKSDIISCDILYGLKTLRSSHIVRLVDGTLS